MTLAPCPHLEVLQRMLHAVELVRQRLLRASRALSSAGVPYAIVGDSAVAAWVASVDVAAVRNTQDVDVMVGRADFDAVARALESVGFVHRRAAGFDLFLDHAGASPQDAVHIIYAGEMVRPGEPGPNPDLADSVDMGDFRVLSLEPLVRITLTAYRRKDQADLLDMLGVGLIDATWVGRFGPVLGPRLQKLIDNPDG